MNLLKGWNKKAMILGGTPQWDTFDVDPDITSLDPLVLTKLQINLSVL